MKHYKEIGALGVVLAVGIATLVFFNGLIGERDNTADAAVLTGTVNRLIAEGAGWSLRYEDQSTYPSPQNRHGTIVRYYNFAVDGGAVSTISLEKGNDVTNVPNNTIIVDGYLEILVPMTPDGVTNSVGVNGTADLIGLSATNLTRAAGIYDIIPTGTAGTFVQLTNNMPCNLTMAGTTAATAGVFQVVLDVYFGQ